MGSQHYLYKRVAVIFGGLQASFGLLLLISWFFQSQTLLALPPTIDTMPFLACLCLALCGVGLLSIYQKGGLPLPNMIGWVIFIISGVSYFEQITHFDLFLPPQLGDMPFKMTFASSLGYLWASVPLIFWKPFYRGNFKDNVPFLFSLVLVVGGVIILLSHLAKLHSLFISTDAANFNFWGVVAIIFFAVGVMSSCYYFKTTTLLSGLMRIPVLVTAALTTLSILLATAFSMEGEKSTKKLIFTKNEEIKSLASTQDFSFFKTLLSNGLGRDFAFYLYKDSRLVFKLNTSDENRNKVFRVTGNLTVEDEDYSYVLYPTNQLVATFINRGLVYVIIIGGFIVSVSFGSLYRMWELTRRQLEVNEKLQLELEYEIGLREHVLESAEIGIWRYDIPKDRLVGDSHICRLFGIEGKEFHGKYEDFIHSIKEECRRELNEAREKSLKTGQPYEVVIPVVWKDKSKHYILSKGKLIKNEQGALQTMQGIAWDISSIKRTQLFLEVSESVSKIFAEGLTIKATAKKFLEALHGQFGWEVFVLRLLNDDATKLECAEVASVRGVPISRFDEAVRRDHVTKGLSIAGVVWSRLSPHWLADVSEQAGVPDYITSIFKGVLAVPVFEDSRLIGVMELYSQNPIVDEMDEELINLIVSLGTEFGQYIKKRQGEEVQQELSAIVNYSHEGMYSITKQGIVKSWNQGAEKIFGWKEEEVVGKPLRRLYITDGLRAHETFFNRARHGEDVERVEAEAIRKDGARIWVKRLTSAVRNAQGELKGSCVLVEDITERRELSKAKHEFISMISHELRTPLTSIHGAVGLLRDDPSQSSKVRELMDVAYRNSQRLTVLVNDILLLEKFELGRMKFHLEEVDLVEVLSEAIKAVLPRANKRSITVKSVSSPSKLLVKAEREKVLHVITGLLSNAVKFSYEGGEVEVSLDERLDVARLTVKDHGIGIPEQVHDRIFTKFYHVDIGSARQTEGTGLGLYIAKSMIEGMEGEIGFESRQHHGSSFYFELPLMKRAKV